MIGLKISRQFPRAVFPALFVPICIFVQLVSCIFHLVYLDTSSETQGQIARQGKCKRAKENGDEEKHSRLFFVSIFFRPFTLPLPRDLPLGLRG